jgi:glutamate synthase (ferredoxin)
LLGAEEFGFATAPLVTMGCIMMRVCHLNTCPVGVATQDPQLRAKFSGDPESRRQLHEVHRQEVRELMAELGFRTLDEMVGRTDVLEARHAVDHWKARGIDLSNLLYSPKVGDRSRPLLHRDPGPRHRPQPRHHHAPRPVQTAIEKGEKVTATLPIRNVNRTVGTILGNEITKRHWHGLPDDTVHLKFKGTPVRASARSSRKASRSNSKATATTTSARASAVAASSSIRRKVLTFAAEENIIAGNTALYGATSGELFLRGMAGERFAVRNSGVDTVVEGVGDHGCEYMTGGRVVVLGTTGRNFAAGMSGGIAYVLDEEGRLRHPLQRRMVDLRTLDDKDRDRSLYELIKKHADLTKSQKAFKVIALWEQMVPQVRQSDASRLRVCSRPSKKPPTTASLGDDALNAAFEANARDVARIGGG